MANELTHTLSYHFDRSLIRAGVRRDFVWRLVYVESLFVLICGTMHVFVSPIHASNTLMGVVLGGFVVLGLATSFRFRRGVDTTFEFWSKQSPDGVVEFRFDEAGFAVSLGESVSRFAWSDIRRLWRWHDVWLFQVARGMSVILSAPEAGPDVKEFVVRCCQDAGVRV